MLAHKRQQLHWRFGSNHIAARESWAIVEHECFRCDAYRFQERLHGFETERFRGPGHIRSGGRRRCHFAERAQDELGVEILTRLQRLRSDQTERDRLKRGDLVLKRRPCAISAVGAWHWHARHQRWLDFSGRARFTRDHDALLRQRCSQ